MNFREATSTLLRCITQLDVANALEVSVDSVRQARLRAGAKAHRSPPKGWEGVLADVAEVRASELQRLSTELGRLAKAMEKQRLRKR